MSFAAVMRVREHSLLLPSGSVHRALLGGIAWGIAMGLGLPLLTFVNCGVICLSDIAFTSSISIVAGIAMMGPIAAFGRGLPRSARPSAGA